MAAGKTTQDELDMLTDEEREGLLELQAEEEGDEADDDGADDQAAAEAAAAEKEAADAEAAKVAEEAAAAAAAAEVATDPAATAAAAVEEEAAAEQAAAHRAPKWEAPADTAEKIKNIDAQLDEIAQKFDDGDMTASELRQQTRALQDQRDELKQVQFKASLSRDMAVDHWTNVAVPEFFKAHKQYSEPGSFLYGALDAEVRKLQTAAADPFDPGILKKAHETIDAQIRKAAGVAETTPAPKAKAKPAAAREIPPTLAHVPAADITETDDSQYAYLDRLADSDALAYEAALAKMPEAERDRYLAM